MSFTLPPLAPTLPDDAHPVLLVAYPGMGLLDGAGPQSVFRAASRYARARGLPGYACHTASPLLGAAGRVAVAQNEETASQ